MVRNLFGVFVILAVGAILWVVALRSTEPVQLDVVWLFLFWLLSLGALVYGGALLLRHAA